MNTYLQEIVDHAHPLHDKQGIGPLVTSLKDKKIVMIGEASHGTKEFYEWRQHITQELIMNHGFNFVAVEGDWPPCQRVNSFVKGYSGVDSYSVLSTFNRWPTWMWANTEFQGFVNWLREWNENRENKVGFHGLDVYSLYESMDQVIHTLRKIEPDLAKVVENKYGCLEAFRHDEKSYAKSLFKAPEGCKQQILDVLNSTLLANIKSPKDNEAWFDVRQNARIVNDAESYYRAMVFGDEDSWNVRDTHMMSTLEMLLDHYTLGSKAIVWEHNTHIGDYRATDMVVNKQINIGGLAREIYGQDNVGLVGFGTYSGSVTASYIWNGPVITFDVPEAKPGSVEEACHSVIANVTSSDFYLMFDPLKHGTALTQIKGHRAIGVVYDPDIEHRGNYVPTSLANRYDAFIFIDHTNELNPLHVTFDKHKFPETYPHGSRV